MAHDRTMIAGSAARMFARLRNGGKKTGVACALILLMVFMWGRVLLGHRPAGATAATPVPKPQSPPQPQPVKVKLVELPKLSGRNDSIQRDFFTAKDGPYSRRKAAGQDTGTDKEVRVISSNGVQEVIRRIAQTLKLEAVLWSESPRVFVNDQLLNVGGKFTVKDGAASYEFEVLQIYVDSVLVRCEGVQLTLELAQCLEVVN